MKLTLMELEATLKGISLHPTLSSAYRHSVSREKKRVRELIHSLDSFYENDIYFDASGLGDGRTVLYWLRNVRKTLVILADARVGILRIQEEELAYNKLVKFRGQHGYDWVSDPFFSVEALTTPEGCSFFDDNEWDRLRCGQSVVGRTSNVKASLMNGEMSLSFAEPANGKLFRRKLATEFAGIFTLI
ncbi:MAG: hypothetical protein M0Z78_08905 [Betaproteobacteria bacterium]|nr:hypothetical protein [Betaproteobacteria bacterium]